MVLSLLAIATADAHPGRRLQIGLIDGQLVAQGANTGDSDGAPPVREYPNVIHDHWHNSPLVSIDSATTGAPEFDIIAPAAELQFRPLELSLVDVKKWAIPPIAPPVGTVPIFEPLASDEFVSLSLGGQQMDSENFGSLFLTTSVSPGGETDIQLTYAVNRRPENEIYVLEFLLSTTNPAVQPSAPVFILLSPDGSSPVEKLHHASLYLEKFLGTRQVPEPASSTLLVAGILSVYFASSYGSRRSL